MSAPELGAGVQFAKKYLLEDEFLTGQSGGSWRATRLKDERAVVIKAFDRSLADDEGAMRSFVREGRILAAWDHPNIPRTLAVGRTEGAPYIVSDFVEGRPLHDEILSLELDVDDVCHIAGQVARVLADAHGRGLVHKALCPEAIYLVKRGDDPLHVRVLDFGSAHLTHAQSGQGAGGRPLRQGKAEYWPPEYIADFLLDARSDLYVLGLLIFEMLCAQPPFVGPQRSVMEYQTDTQARPPSYLSTQPVPSWLDDLVVALLHKDPDQRPQEAGVVADGLRDRRWSS